MSGKVVFVSRDGGCTGRDIAFYRPARRARGMGNAEATRPTPLHKLRQEALKPLKLHSTASCLFKLVKINASPWRFQRRTLTRQDGLAFVSITSDAM